MRVFLQIYQCNHRFHALSFSRNRWTGSEITALKGWKFMHCQFRTGSDSKGFIGCVCQNDGHISNIVTHCPLKMLKWLVQLFVLRLTVFIYLVMLYLTVHFAVYCNCMSKYQVILMNNMSLICNYWLGLLVIAHFLLQHLKGEPT